jgi:hypothetical protein
MRYAILNMRRMADEHHIELSFTWFFEKNVL